MTATDEHLRVVAPTPPDRRRGRRPFAALSGLLAAAVTLGVAELVAVPIGPGSAPVLAVGAAAIDAAPPALKQFAVDHFGTHDKPVLLGGIVVVLAVAAAVLGLVGLRRRGLGVAGVVLLGAVGAVTAVARPVGGLAYALPSAIGAVAGVLALLALLTPLRAGQPGRGQHSLRSTGRRGLNRRGFLIAGGVTAMAAAVSAAAGKVLLDARYDVGASRATVRLPTPRSVPSPMPPQTELDIPGLSSFFTANADFYRVDTALIVPQLSPRDWSLRIHGMVDAERTISYGELIGRGLIQRDVTLSCVSNEIGGPYISNARWLGVPLAPLLREVGITPGADQIVTRSVDGWTAGTPVDVVLDGRDAMLAVGMNGAPLPLAHGFPVRMLVPGLYGYVSATKWVVDMELTTFSHVSTYWRQRGWAAQAPIKTESRIDTPKPFATVARGTVPIAGLAWAPRKGIAKVEVSIDNGPWQTARLAGQDSTDTWRQWVYQWPATPGNHIVQVRATDKSGYRQTEARVNPIPDGATGWASSAFTVR